MNNSNERFALVTGSSGGIGSAVAGLLRAEGTRVIGLDRLTSDATQDFVECDLATESALLQSCSLIERDYGAPSFIAICHGTYYRRGMPDYTSALAQSQFEDNYFSTFRLLQFFLPQLIERRFGRIAAVTSQAGAAGGYDPIYASAKAASVALVKSIAREYAQYNVTANAVSPGPVDTSMANAMGDDRKKYYLDQIPSKVFARAADVASAVVWLLNSHQAVNGSVIDVDGGLLRR